MPSSQRWYSSANPSGLLPEITHSLCPKYKIPRRLLLSRSETSAREIQAKTRCSNGRTEWLDLSDPCLRKINLYLLQKFLRWKEMFQWYLRRYIRTFTSDYFVNFPIHFNTNFSRDSSGKYSINSFRSSVEYFFREIFQKFLQISFANFSRISFRDSQRNITSKVEPRFSQHCLK